MAASLPLSAPSLWNKALQGAGARAACGDSDVLQWECNTGYDSSSVCVCVCVCVCLCVCMCVCVCGEHVLVRVMVHYAPLLSDSLCNIHQLLSASHASLLPSGCLSIPLSLFPQSIVLFLFLF